MNYYTDVVQNAVDSPLARLYWDTLGLSTEGTMNVISREDYDTAIDQILATVDIWNVTNALQDAVADVVEDMWNIANADPEEP